MHTLSVGIGTVLALVKESCGFWELWKTKKTVDFDRVENSRCLGARNHWLPGYHGHQTFTSMRSAIIESASIPPYKIITHLFPKRPGHPPWQALMESQNSVRRRRVESPEVQLLHLSY
jgi:hypothetical protein